MTNTTDNFPSLTLSPMERREELIFSVLRAIAPESREPVLFSQIAVYFKSPTPQGVRFADIVGMRPGAFAEQYRGTKLRFSRDNNTPPLLYCARTEGPWTAVPEETRDLWEWADQAPLDLNSVNFKDAADRWDLQAVMLAWLRKRVNHASQQVGIRVGCRYEGTLQRLTKDGKGAVICFTTPAVEGVTGYLPLAALPIENGILDRLAKETATFRILDSQKTLQGTSLLLRFEGFCPSPDAADSTSSTAVPADTGTVSRIEQLNRSLNMIEQVVKHLRTSLTAVEEVAQRLEDDKLMMPVLASSVKSGLTMISDIADRALRKLDGDLSTRS